MCSSLSKHQLNKEGGVVRHRDRGHPRFGSVDQADVVGPLGPTEVPLTSVPGCQPG